MTPTPAPEPAIELDFHVTRAAHGRKVMKAGGSEPPAPPAATGTPRIAVLMALAIVMQEQARRGEAASYADLARRHGVTRARMSQIMDLVNLAPDMQERVLDLTGDAAIADRAVRKAALLASWEAQRASLGASTFGSTTARQSTCVFTHYV